MKKQLLSIACFICSAFVLSAQQDTILFEELRDGNIPTGWTAVDIDMQTAAGGYARLEEDTSTLATPTLDLSGFTDVNISFSVAKWGSGGDGPITVDVSNDGGTTWTAQSFDSPTPTGSTYLPSGPDTLTITGSNVQIRFTRPNSPSRKRLRDVLILGTPVSTPPPSGLTPMYPISTITTIDTLGVADSLGVQCFTKGVVLGVNARSNGLQFTLWDDNAGIGTFSASNDWGYTVNEGDSLIIGGSVGQFNGLTQMSLDTVIHVNSGNPIPSPSVVTELNESTESQLVTLENLEVVSVGGGFNFNVDVTDGTNNFTVRILGNTDVGDSISFAIGDSLCSVTGIGGQFDNSSPFLSGYQLLPRYYTDVDTTCGTQDTSGSEPAPVPLYSIGTVTSTDNDGVVDSLNVYCAVEGIVYGIDFRGNGHQFTIIDETGGINVFSFNDVDNYDAQEGDEIRVFGQIGQFRGLIQIEPDTIQLLSQDNCIPFPTIVTELDQSTNSHYIELRNVSVVDENQWPTPGNSSNVDIVSLDGDTFLMRIDRSTLIADTMPQAPSGLFHLTGIGGQFTGFNPPFNSGFQIFPMFVYDIQELPVPALEDVYINEVMTNNQSVIEDVNNAYTNWIEIYNGRSEAIDLAGHFITNDENHTELYRIPRCHENQTTVVAGEFAIIWASMQEETGALYTGFELQDETFVGLYTPDGSTSVDEVNAVSLAADHSYGREDDGAEAWVTFETSTPGESNAGGVILSVTDYTPNATIKAYPNPVSTGVLNFSETVDVELFDISGKMLIKQNRVNNLDVNHLSSGMYLIKAKGEVIRIVVQ